MPESQPSTAQDRRHFALGVIYGLWGLIGAALSIPAALFLFLPPKLKRRGNWVDLGDLSQFKPNTPEEVTFRHTRVDGWRVIADESAAWVVVRSPEKISVFAPQCTHLGCAYHWNENNRQFYCPCHSSAFNIEGEVLSGPAPRPLDQYTTRLNGKHLEVWPSVTDTDPHA